MKHFTVSAKGRKGHNFDHLGYMYQLDIELSNRFHDFYIHADNRKAAIKTGETIVSTITFESTTQSIQAEVNKQNGLQQLKVAYRMLDTHEDKEKVYDYIKRLKAHFNIVDETKEEEKAEVETINNETNENETIQNNEQQPTNTYTAYNRSFSTYNEAYNYCVQSDFDPAFITIEEPETASQHSLQLDLQLFSTDTTEEPTKPFKQPYASYKDGVSKFGIGKHLELI